MSPPPDARSARERWNERYRRDGDAAFGHDPSQWLVEQRSRLQAHRKGRALDLACGPGRNSLFLAELGFEVDAVDVSEVALEGLRAHAARRRLRVHALRADLEADAFPDASYEVIVVFNFLLRSLFEPIERALAPGGLLVFETWRQDPGGRRRALDPGELVAAFPGLELLEHAEREAGERLREAIVARRPD